MASKINVVYIDALNFNICIRMQLYTIVDTCIRCKNLKEGAIRYGIKLYIFIVLLFYKSMYNIWYSITGIVVRHNIFFNSTYLLIWSIICYLSVKPRATIIMWEDSKKKSAVIYYNILDVKHFAIFLLFCTRIVPQIAVVVNAMYQDRCCGKKR